MITIDQAKIDAPDFPRSQEWWTRFAGIGTTATVRNDGTVTLEPNGWHYDYVTWMAIPDHDNDTPCPIAESKLTAVQKRHAGERLAQRMRGLRPLAAAIVAEPVQS